MVRDQVIIPMALDNPWVRLSIPSRDSWDSGKGKTILNSKSKRLDEYSFERNPYTCSHGFDNLSGFVYESMG